MKRISAAIIVLASAVLFAGAAIDGGDSGYSLACVGLGLFLFISGIVEYNKACNESD